MNKAKFNLNFYDGVDYYSDGDVENIILDIVKNNKKYEDILAKTFDWAILYHLSPARENLLSWYDFNSDASLLEIGGGCGAITGLFANNLKNVKTVELSKRRGEIIYHRHSHCENLEIIIGNLNDIVFERKFDYVTLIGVLEYAGRFTTGKTPFKSFLTSIAQKLCTNGKLLLAIENKYGLKYWAGAREDHLGRVFEGIEDYPDYKGIKTFGKLELENMLAEVGFSQISFYYPMPDYKLPSVVYSDDYLPKISDTFDTVTPNFDQERYVLFNENLAYKSIIKNNQFPFFANSFLIEATL